MSKQNFKEEQHINVSVRIRPNDKECDNKVSPFLEVLSRKELLSRTIYNQKRYVFDRVFDGQSTQQDIYNAIVAPLIPEVIDGYNCTVFAYGQTGTGKTYTMEGIHNIDNQINAGIIPRALGQIFKILHSVNTESSVKVSYLELYNEELFDLLSQELTPKPIRIYEDKTQKGSVILQGLEELSVTNFNQVYKILEQGTERRRIASTIMNSTSSRSHTVFTIIVHLREITIDGEELVKTGKLNLVDLAGSENISKSGAIDKRAREAGSINQSLLTLGRVIKALTEKTTHIPYRESKLTRILQDSLGGHTKTSLIATVSSATSNQEETLNTLEYAMRARCIQNKPELNHKISRTALINQYSDTIEKLQRDLVAVRTGTGFFVDESNYAKLLSDNEAQKIDLLDKISQIRKLEEDILNNTEKLDTLRSNWIEAANNVEHLSNEKRILQKDLILVKEVNKKKELELQQYKETNKVLTDETQKLLSDIQVHSLNEDVFHKKVSYLYETSQNNRNITEVFYNMYSKLNNKVVYHIDSCISTTLQLITDNENHYLQNMPHILFNQLMSNIDCLQQALLSMQNYTVEHFQHKELLENRYDSYYVTLKGIIENACQKSDIFRSQFSKKLICLRDKIQHITNQNICDYKDIISDLIHIRNMATNEVATITDIIQQFHVNIMNGIDELQDHFQQLNEKQQENLNTINCFEQEFEEDILEFMNKCKSKLSVCRAQHNDVLKSNSDLVKKMEQFKENTHNSLEVIKADVATKLDTLRNSDTSNLTKFSDQVELNETKTSNNVQEVVNSFKGDYIDFIEDRTNLFSSKTHQTSIESTDNEHFNELSSKLESAQNTAHTIKIDVHSVIDKHKACSDEFSSKTNEIKARLKDGLSDFNDTSQRIQHVVDEFCGCKLQHPTHVGDTPQKVQPKSSLYKETLSRNCFRDDDKNRYAANEANKENSNIAVNTHSKAKD